MFEADVDDSLVAAAREARERAYAPYSNFAVGAAVLGADGRVYRGCNIENVALGATICAERVALFCAVADGCTDIAALAVIGPGDAPIAPCGCCRQVMVELAPGARVVMAADGGARRSSTVSELVPGPSEAPELSAQTRARGSGEVRPCSRPRAGPADALNSRTRSAPAA